MQFVSPNQCRRRCRCCGLNSVTNYGRVIAGGFAEAKNICPENIFCNTAPQKEFNTEYGEKIYARGDYSSCSSVYLPVWLCNFLNIDAT